MMTSDEQRLTELRTLLGHLVKWRREEIDRAQKRIEQINRRFDSEAAELNRKIRELEPEPEPQTEQEKPTPQTKPPRKRKTKPLTIDDMRNELQRRGKLNGG